MLDAIRGLNVLVDGVDQRPEGLVVQVEPVARPCLRRPSASSKLSVPRNARTRVSSLTATQGVRVAKTCVIGGLGQARLIRVIHPLLVLFRRSCIGRH